MRLVKLTMPQGLGDIFINPAHVTYIRWRTERDLSWTEIHFHGNDWTGVTESLDVVAPLLSGEH